MTRSSVTKAVYALSAIAPDLHAAIYGRGDQQAAIALGVWESALEDLDDATIAATLAVAVREHKERNITPAHFLGYFEQVAEARHAFPSDADIMADICEGRARLPYHADRVDFGGWEPTHGEITQHAARILGGWATIDREDWHEPSARRTIREFMPQLKRQHGVRRALPASVMSAAARLSGHPTRRVTASVEIARGSSESYESVAKTIALSMSEREQVNPVDLEEERAKQIARLRELDRVERSEKEEGSED